MPPDPPYNLSVINQDMTSIGLSWNTGFNGNSPLVNVSISYESSNYPSDGTQYILLPLVYSATLSGLHPNANYSIRVALVNAAGFTSSFTTIMTSTLSLSKLNKAHYLHLHVTICCYVSSHSYCCSKHYCSVCCQFNTTCNQMDGECILLGIWNF